MHSKNMIKLKTENIKQIENVGCRAAYLCTRRAWHVIKVILCNPCHFKKPKYPIRKTTRFAVRIAAPMENNRSTAVELGKATKGCCTV